MSKSKAIPQTKSSISMAFTLDKYLNSRELRLGRITESTILELLESINQGLNRG